MVPSMLPKNSKVGISNFMNNVFFFNFEGRNKKANNEIANNESPYFNFTLTSSYAGCILVSKMSISFCFNSYV